MTASSCVEPGLAGRPAGVQALLLSRYLTGGPSRSTATAPAVWRADIEPETPSRHLPATVLLGLRFIERHAQEPVGLVEIAAAARLSPRALQAAFRRHLDTTPLAHLRSVRLARVHAALVAAQPGHGQTVSELASNWGFNQLSRFAREYRRRYGESPRETLVRAS